MTDHIGSSFGSFLDEEGIREELEQKAIKRAAELWETTALHEQAKRDAAAGDDLSVITTKRGQYVLPRSAACTWEQHRPGMNPPPKLADHKFWPTPEGWVLVRPDKTEEEQTSN